jgi:hypothetical protein
MYGAEVWQILTTEINKILSKETDVLRSARKSRMEGIKNEHVKEILYFPTDNTHLMYTVHPVLFSSHELII